MAGSKNSKKIPLTESMEDYLEEIYEQTNTRKVARVRDIANSLGVSMSSVTGALKKLANKNLVNYDKYQYITLTEEGAHVAAEIKGRHRILTQFLEEALGVEPRRAEINACRMEHAMDSDVISRFLAVLEYIKTNPDSGSDWIQNFQQYYKSKLSDKPAKHAPTEQDLQDIKAGQKVSITRIDKVEADDSRIARLGLLPGAAIFVKANNANDGQITIEFDGATIDLKSEESEAIHVRVNGA